MDLFEYIKSQLPQMPNVAIMKDLGASDELVEYVKESPENTNLNVMGSITSGGDIGEVWATITIADTSFSIKSDGTYEGESATTSKTFAEWEELFTKHDEYEINIVTSSETIPIHEYYETEYVKSISTTDGIYSITLDSLLPDITIASTNEANVPAEIVVKAKES